MNDPLAAIRASAAKYPAIALVLQGGGALGAYQCCVYQGLHEAGIRPTGLAGISIGAINSAISAGNVPEDRVDRLQAFWDEICEPAEILALPALAVRSAAAMLPDNAMVDAWAGSLSAVAVLWQGQRGFFTPRAVSPFLLNDGSASATSFYHTAALRTTLERMVDRSEEHTSKIQTIIRNSYAV